MRFTSVAIMALCGVTGPAGWASMERAAAVPTLEGSAWVLSSLPGHTLVSGVTPTVRFEGGRVSGSDGCNRYTMPFTEHGSAIHIGPPGPSTLMACAEETMTQAEKFLAALISARGFRFGAETLDLLDGDGAVVATLMAQANALAGVSWHVININNGQAIVGAMDGSTLTLVFDEEGRVGGTAGCNQFTAAYQADGDSLRFTRVTATRMACPDQALMEQESVLLRALARVSAFRCEGDRLDLLQENGSIAIILIRDP